MRSTLRCLLACAAVRPVACVGHAGPIGDSLRAVSAKQAASAPVKSRQRVWVGGIVLTVVGGAMMIGGQGRQQEPELGCGIGVPVAVEGGIRTTTRSSAQGRQPLAQGSS